MKITFSFFIIIVLFSCRSTSKEDTLAPIARVGDTYLEKTKLITAIPTGLTETDSILFANAFINSWAKEHLLLGKAALNLQDKDKEAIALLVQQYKNDLLINRYKEAIVKQELDTVISTAMIAEYYATNKGSFLLNETILQLKFVNFNKTGFKIAEIKSLLNSDKDEDIAKLKTFEISFNAASFNDTIWYKMSTLYDVIPDFYPKLKEKLLKKTKTVQLEDSLTVSLVAVKAIKRKNEVAPLSFKKEIIRQIILHKRKLELLKKIEKDLLEDAIINKTFETYK